MGCGSFFVQKHERKKRENMRVFLFSRIFAKRLFC